MSVQKFDKFMVRLFYVCLSIVAILAPVIIYAEYK